MAQRVYMIPVTENAESRFCHLLDAKTDQELEDLFLETRQSATRHLTTLEVGKKFIEVASDAIPDDQQGVFFGVFTACRPYFITPRDHASAARRTTELYDHSDRDDLFSKFTEEASAITDVPPDSWSQIDQASDFDLHDDEWNALIDDIRTARAMRAAFLNDEAYGVEVRKKVEIAGIEAYSQDETETIQVRGSELARHFGAVIGPNFGRIAGLCSPTSLRYNLRRHWIPMDPLRHFALDRRSQGSSESVTGEENGNCNPGNPPRNSH